MSIHEHSYRIGKNAKENWALFEDSEPSDFLFHLSSFPSGYLILKCDENITPDVYVLNIASIVCKVNTKYRYLKNIKVDYTRCKNVQKGDFVGEIIYKSNRKVKQINPSSIVS